MNRDVARPAQESQVQQHQAAWAPLAIPIYRSFWIAGLFSNMGTWMHETGSQWLMTSLEPSAHMVSAVRTAMTVPIFLLALPAGVWADRFNRRRWLLTTQSLLLLIASAMAILALTNQFTPGLLLVMTAIMGCAIILNQPAWQALTPELVPAAMVPTAVQAGSVSFNLARSVGPAIAGLLIASQGVGATYVFNAVSFLGILTVLVRWRPEAEAPRLERAVFWRELHKGVVVVTESMDLRHVLIRLVVFSISASILWSLLPLVATDMLLFRERGFGSCLGIIGTGAVLGVWWLPRIRSQYSSENIILITQLAYASILAIIAFTDSRWIIIPALLLIGTCWMTTMTTLNATAQVYLPREYRARGMAAYMMCFAFGMAAGSAFWGWLASQVGLGTAFLIAACTLAGGAILCHRLKIGSLIRA